MGGKAAKASMRWQAGQAGLAAQTLPASSPTVDSSELRQV